MSEIEFSTITHSEQAFQDLQQVLEVFERQQRCRVKVLRFGRTEAWPNILDTALHAKGPDISQIGVTWLSSLVAMNALRPFTSDEVAAAGAPAAFYPACWESAHVMEAPETWAIPWESNTAVIFYRRDLLGDTGIDDGSAFCSPRAMEETLHRLRDTPVESAWMPPLGEPAWDLLHSASSWLFGAGGTFLTVDGKRTAFTSGPALTGLSAFFNLFRFINPASYLMAVENYITQFARGRVAAVVGPADYGLAILHRHMPADLRQQVGIALPPGVPTSTGSSLVIWRHTRQTQDREGLAVRLARFLSERQTQADLFHSGGGLPARRDVLPDLSLEMHNLKPSLEKALTEGRTYPAIKLWHRVETQLALALSEAAAAVLENPNSGLEVLLRQKLEPIAKRLDMTLG